MIYTSYNDEYTRRIVQNNERNHIICKLIRTAVKRNKYVIVVVDRILHLEEISSRLKGKIKYAVVAGTYKKKGININKRFERKDKFERGEIRCLIVNKVMKKGIDIKRVDLIINASGKPSANDALQIFGRGVRLHKDKVGLICIDINDFDPDKKNPFSKASKKRIRAYNKAGLTVKKIEYTDDMSYSQLFEKAEQWLQKEISK